MLLGSIVQTVIGSISDFSHAEQQKKKLIMNASSGQTVVRDGNCLFLSVLADEGQCNKGK
jgi:hypothetical protein